MMTIIPAYLSRDGQKHRFYREKNSYDYAVEEMKSALSERMN